MGQLLLYVGAKIAMFKKAGVIYRLFKTRTETIDAYKAAKAAIVVNNNP